MPIIHAVDQRKGQRRLVSLVIPVRTNISACETERWHWPELHAGKSAIQGFGLFPRSTDALDWNSVSERRPVALPYLGKETEVESSVQARVLRTVLCGGFDVVQRQELPCPDGHAWVQDGLYVTLISNKDRKKLSPQPPVVDDPTTKLLQVSVDMDLRGAISYVEEGDEQVCYLQYKETRELLHLPEHIFKMLAGHANDEHADRNMATHLVQFTRANGVHLLVSAHPFFRHSAFIMGNANEPPKGAPSLELLELRLVAALDDDPLMLRAGLVQDPAALEHLKVFADEHPEVMEKSTFFVSRKEGSCFREDEELTVVYGNQYKRTYSTWGHAGTPLRYHVPFDTYAEGVWERWASYPHRCPGWFNVDQQPTNRPAFERGADPKEVKVMADLPAVVNARKLGLDGDAAAQRLAKLVQLIWPRQLPLLAEQEHAAQTVDFEPPASEKHGAAMLSVLRVWPQRKEWERDAAVAELLGPERLVQPMKIGGVPTFPKLIPRMATEDDRGDEGGETPAEVKVETSCEERVDKKVGGSTARRAAAIGRRASLSYGSSLDESTADDPPSAEPPVSTATARGVLSGLVEHDDFELPSWLSNVNKDELMRLVKAEESYRTREHDDDDDGPELSETDWSAPWRFPLGSIVWCKMPGYPTWPAEVTSSAVHDQVRRVVALKTDGMPPIRLPLTPTRDRPPPASGHCARTAPWECARPLFWMGSLEEPVHNGEGQEHPQLEGGH